MEITGFTADLLKNPLRETSKAYNWNVKFHHIKETDSVVRLQLAVTDPDGVCSRISGKDRKKIQFACWHCHRKFFLEIYAICRKYGLPPPRIHTDGVVPITYHSEKHFLESYEATGDDNISMHPSPTEEPLIHRFACECEQPYENTMQGRIDPRVPGSALTP
jgi:hypothetical protein